MSTRWMTRCVGPLLVLAIGLGCGDLQAMLGGGDDDTIVAAAEQKLSAGDLPGAAAEYQGLAATHPDSVAVAVGLSYVQLLQGDLDAADGTLAAIEPKAGEKVGEIKLRRALVALEKRELEQVETFGVDSGLPEGKLLAAEAFLVELDSDRALELLRELSADGGVVGETARTYLELLESGNQHKGALAEVSALWALGDRAQAVESVEDSLKNLPEEPSKGKQILLWAGRAVTSGRPDIARSLLEDTFPPEGQQWRYQATLAMIEIADGNPDDGIGILQGLREAPDVPSDGVEDAIATACGVAKDPEVARRLVEGMESSAVARCLHQAGASADAAARAPAGGLKSFLENP